MKFFNNFKIGVRLGISFIIILLLILVSGISGYWGISNISGATTQLLRTDARIAEYSAHAWAGILGMRQHEKNMFIYFESEIWVEGYYKKWVKQYDNCKLKLDLIKEIVKEEDDKKEVLMLMGELEKYRFGIENVYKQILSMEIESVKQANYKMTKNKKGIRELENGLRKISQKYSEKMQEVDKIINDTYLKTAFIFLGLIMITIPVTLVLSIYITRSIKRPLLYSVDIADKISKGDLTIDVEATGKDEISQLLSAEKEIVLKVKDVVSGIKNAIDHMAVSSEEMTGTIGAFSDNAQSQAAVAEEVTATIEEVSAGIDNIAQSASEQLARLNSLLAKMHDLSGMINKMDERINETLVVSENISSKAKSGESSLNQMNQSMNKITESSQKMLNIVGLINDISDQINLLSLNAAIEAARAGDAGRGFAVVADEISKLADQTAKSIKEIDSLVQINNDEIESGLASTSETFDIITTIIKEIRSIDEMMNNISENMKDQLSTRDIVTNELETVKQRLDAIKVATEEQNIATTEITKSITSINDLTQSNASGAEELTGSSEELAGMAEGLKGKVEFFQV